VKRDPVDRYVRDQGVPFDGTIICPASEKVGRCLNEGIELLVDDRPDTIESVVAAGLPVAAISYRYNQLVRARHGVPHAADWLGLEPLLRGVLVLDAKAA
jgi:hypothetical protein